MLRVSLRQAPKQLMLWNIEEMHFATCAKLLRPCAEVFAFFTRPKPIIKDDVYSQSKRPARDFPLQRFNARVPSVVLRRVRILPEQAEVPPIGGQAHRRVLRFERQGQRGLPA